MPAGVIAAPPVMQMPKPEAKIIEPEQNKPQMALQAITLSQLQQVSSKFYSLQFIILIQQCFFKELLFSANIIIRTGLFSIIIVYYIIAESRL